jgi:protein SCO1/2
MAKIRVDRTLYLLVVILMTAFVGYFLVTVYENKIEPLPILGPVAQLENGKGSYHQVPEFTFTDQNGESFQSGLLEGKIYVANYFFTSCPTICPQMSANLGTLHQRFRNDKNLEILSFTVDPERDSPERMKQYGEKFESDPDQWHFLTGDKKELYKLARNGFFLSATEGDGGQYDFIHSENFVLVDGEGHIRGYYEGTKESSVEQISNDITKLRKLNP